MGKYEQALADFDRAIDLDEKMAWAIAERGETYRLMEKYELALADFDRAIDLDEKMAWAIASRGETYRLMEKYERRWPTSTAPSTSTRSMPGPLPVAARPTGRWGSTSWRWPTSTGH